MPCKFIIKCAFKLRRKKIVTAVSIATGYLTRDLRPRRGFGCFFCLPRWHGGPAYAPLAGGPPTQFAGPHARYSNPHILERNRDRHRATPSKGIGDAINAHSYRPCYRHQQAFPTKLLVGAFVSHIDQSLTQHGIVKEPGSSRPIMVPV